jgi:hypothetical protein
MLRDPTLSAKDERERANAELRAYFEHEIREMRREMADELRACREVLAQAERLHRLATAMRVMEPSEENLWVQ